MAKELLFDLDGTLLDSVPAVEAAWLMWANLTGLDFTSLPNFHGRPSRDTLRQIVAPSEVSEAEALIKEFEALTGTGSKAKPGAKALLASIPHGRWALVTSGHRDIALSRMVSAGLPQPHLMVTGNDVTLGKPHPEPFLLGQSSPRHDEEFVVAVEDTVAGLASAKAADCFAIGLVGTMSAEELAPWADILVLSIEDIVVIESLDDGVLLEITPVELTH
jgi:sugar-phosphatase